MKDEQKEVHVMLGDGKILFASEEFEMTLCLFYFGFKSSAILSQLNREFLPELIMFTQDRLEKMGLTWDDVPEDNSDWGDIIIKIKQMERNGIEWKQINSTLLGKKVFGQL